MTDLSLTILPETPQDGPAIERLHERTFGPGRYARTAFRIREGRGHLLEFSFTARIGTLLVGSIRLTPVRIGETLSSAHNQPGDTFLATLTQPLAAVLVAL